MNVGQKLEVARKICDAANQATVHYVDDRVKEGDDCLVGIIEISMKIEEEMLKTTKEGHEEPVT